MADIKFGVDGWRAVLARDFTFYSCRVLSQCIAVQASRNPSKQGLVVAYDNRFMAEEFARECARVIAGNGVKTYMIRKATTTALAAFAVQHLEAAGAIMITAGNAPYEYCGIKYIDSESKLASPELTDTVEIEAGHVMESGKLYELDLYEAETLDLYKEIEVERPYIDSLKRLVKPECFNNKNLKVIIDPLFGSGLALLEKILQELGCEVKTIHNYRDPLFGGFCPQAGKENLIALQRAVITQQAEIGLAMDGDAGGFGIIDKDGSFIEPDMFLSILLNHLLQTRTVRGPVVRSQAATHLLDRIANKNGLPVIEAPAGFRNIGQVMHEKAGMLAAEESGEMTVGGHLPISDAVLACLLAVELVACSGLTLTEQLSELMEQYGPVVALRLNIPRGRTDWYNMEKRINGNKPPQSGREKDHILY